MAATRSDEFIACVRRAYEWGRLRHGVLRSWPALVMTAVSCALCHELELSLAIGACLLALATGLSWYGRVAARAAGAGLKAGWAAFLLPLAAFQLHFQAHCPGQTEVLFINGSTGVVIGLALSLASRRVEAQRNLFLLCSTVIAALCGTLACILFGPIGLAGMAAGAFLSTAPVAAYRAATA